MAKGNAKAKEEVSKEAVRKQFDDLEEILTDLKDGVTASRMPLLAKSFELDLEILKSYKKAFMALKIK